MSIFYLLGIKISNKIDVIKKCTPVEKIALTPATVKKSAENAIFHKENKPETKIDSLKPRETAPEVQKN